MKKMKVVFLAFATLTLGLTSCKKKEEPQEVAEEHNDAVIEDKDLEKDAQFLVEVAGINMAEIKLGELAQQKGTTSHVKELGKMMVDAHTKAMAEVSTLAAQKNILLPTDLSDNEKEDYKNLSEKSGIDFDKEYSDIMVKGHKKAIEKFEDENNNGTDAEIKVFAMKMIPELKLHLEHAEACQKMCNK